jgi:hypothetical protein
VTIRLVYRSTKGEGKEFVILVQPFEVIRKIEKQGRMRAHTSSSRAGKVEERSTKPRKTEVDNIHTHTHTHTHRTHGGRRSVTGADGANSGSDQQQESSVDQGLSTLLNSRIN